MAKTNTVVIGCKLPHGIILHGTQGQPIEINGMNKSMVLGGFGITNVDEGEAAYLFAQYSEYAPFESKAIFYNESPKIADLVSMSRELADERTGFEGLNPDAPAPGMAPEDEGQLAKAKNKAARQPRPAAAPKSAADKEAANELASLVQQ